MKCEKCGHDTPCPTEVNDMAGLDITEIKNKVHHLTRDIAHNTTMDNEDILSRINKIFTTPLPKPKDGSEGRERLAHCPTCKGEIKSTERRPDGNSVCANGHKHKTADFFKYQAPKPSTDSPVEGLREILVKMKQRATPHGMTGGGGTPPCYECLNGLIKYVDSHPVNGKGESLAELADRKGKKIISIEQSGYADRHREKFWWAIGVDVKHHAPTGGEWFHGPTYAAAENAAREYLMGLPDKTLKDRKIE